ncbi:MAG: hypothetical protein WCJ74_02460 [bacterium]
MNLFLAQKTTPLKRNLAKLFAVFLVCFFVGVSANSVLAQSTGVDLGGAFGTNNAQSQTNGAISQTNSTVYYAKDFSNGNTLYKAVTTNTEFNPWLAAAIPGGLGTAAAAIFSKGTTAYYKVNEDGSIETTPTPKLSNKNLYALPIPPIGLTGDLTYNQKDGVYNWLNPQTGKIEEINPADTTKLAEIAKNSESVKKAAQVAQAKNINAAQQAAANVAAGGSASNPLAKPDMKCGPTEIGCWLAKAIYYITIKPASWLLAASGWLFEAVLYKTVVGLSGTLKGNVYGTVGSNSFYTIIKLVWGIFRDLINMSFIFLLLYASIKTILFADTAGLKKTITNIIIVALLINFSLFFVEITIDVSNNLAVTIYNSINQGSSSQNNIAAAFMDKLSLQNLMSQAMDKGNAGKATGDFTSMLTICIFGSAFILVLAVVFFVMAVLFVVRFIQFVILMMMSPIGMGAIAIPQLNMAFTDGGFWKNLLNQCFFAPIMLIFLWISIRILDVLNSLNGVAPNAKIDVSGVMTVATQAAGKEGQGGLGTYILAYLVIIFVLIKGMEFAKTMSAKGAGAVQSNFLKYSGANWMQNKMQNTPRYFGNKIGNVPGATARNLIGRGANRLADRPGFRDWASKGGIIGKNLYKATLGTADAKFGGSVGFKKSEEERTKAETAFALDLINRKTLAERKAVEDKKIAQAKAQKALGGIKNPTEAIKLAGGHTAKQSALAEQKIEIERDIAHAKHEGKAEQLKTSKIELADVEEKIKNVDNALKSAFKKAGIEMADTTAESIAKAMTKAEKIREVNAKEQGVDLKANPEKLEELLERLNKEEDEANMNLKKIEEHLEVTAKDRSVKYQKSLQERRLGNLFLPSKTSKETAMNIRKDAEKTPDQRDNEKLVKMLEKALKENSKSSEPKIPKKEEPTK